MDSAPINPSDISFLYGGYSTSKPFPCVPGFEGSGTVLVNGYIIFQHSLSGGIFGWSLVGKKVAFVA